jgi:hypothetical protein
MPLPSCIVGILGPELTKPSVFCVYVRVCSYGLDLFLLSIDEGIAGYRDDSLETVKRNEQTYGIPLEVTGGADLALQETGSSSVNTVAVCLMPHTLKEHLQRMPFLAWHAVCYCSW